MKKKNIITLIMGIAICAILLTACGSKKETTNRSGASVATKIGQQTAQKKAAAKGRGKTGGAKPAGKLGGKKYH